MAMVHHKRESIDDGAPRELLIDKERKQKRTKTSASGGK